MKINDIKKKAKTLGLDAGKLNKSDLIRAIQNAEGNRPCFEAGVSKCGQKECCWFGDCQN